MMAFAEPITNELVLVILVADLAKITVTLHLILTAFRRFATVPSPLTLLAFLSGEHRWDALKLQ
jgi:hypothetical protein